MSVHGKTTAQERFELLSAYTDNELNSLEKAQVELWLRDDCDYRHQYNQLLRVKSMLLDLPTPSSIKTDVLVEKVITKITIRSRRKWALGAMLTALIVGAFGLGAQQRWQVADESINNEEQLILAMEKPIVPLPQSLIREN